MQKTTVPNCPQKTVLTDFLSDRLGIAARTELVGHVESCLNCQSALEQMLDSGQTTGLPAISAVDSAGDESAGIDREPTRLLPRLQTIMRGTSAVRQDLETSPASATGPVSESGLPRIDGFQISRVLGRGASGIVYEAVQTELNRRVAIKLITGNLFSDSSGSDRFLREARSVAALVHPNIARLYQISTSQPCGPYLVFEYVAGLSLEALLKQHGALDPGTATGICRNVASAMATAHESHLVHRDLKPSNILVEEGSCQARVVDFGLAIDPASEVRITREAFIAGTPAYMSPEQIQAPRAIDHRSDIYSLGVVLYEILTGEIPFRGLSKSTLERIVCEMPRRPTEINPAIPRDLETICLKSMAKLPQHRYQSMREFDLDLECWQQGRPISARPVSRWSRSVRWARRNPVTATLVSVIATLLVLAAVASVAGLVILSRANHRAQLANEKSAAAASTALRQRDQLLETVETLVYGISDRAENEFLDHDELQITLLTLALDGLMRNSASDDPTVYRTIADVNLRLGSVFLRLEDFDMARDFLDEAQALAEQLADRADSGDSGDSGEPTRRLQSRVAWEQVRLHSALEEPELARRKMAEAEKLSPPLPQDSLIADSHRSQILGEALGRLDFAFLLADSGSADQGLTELRRADELGQLLMRTSLPADAGEMDSWAFQGLHARNEAVMELADLMWNRKETDEAARLDALAMRLTRQFDIYGQSWIPEGADDDPTASSLQLAEQYWREPVLSDEELKSGEPLSNDEKLAQADCHYNLAWILAEKERFRRARDHSLQAIGLYRESMNASAGFDHDIAISAGDALVQAVELDRSANNVTDSTRELLAELGRLTDSLAKNPARDRDLQREINRLRWQYLQLLK